MLRFVLFAAKSVASWCRPMFIFLDVSYNRKSLFFLLSQGAIALLWCCVLLLGENIWYNVHSLRKEYQVAISALHFSCVNILDSIAVLSVVNVIRCYVYPDKLTRIKCLPPILFPLVQQCTRNFSVSTTIVSFY